MNRYVTALALSLTLVPTYVVATVIPPIGLAPGSQYQLVFVTANPTFASSTDIGFYNSFVTDEAALSSALPIATWHAVGTTPFVSASVNAPSGGLPVYNTAGLKVADASTGLYTALFPTPIQYDQFGDALNTKVWTGTDYLGEGAESTRPLGGTYTSGPNTFVDFGESGASFVAWAKDPNGNDPWSPFELASFYALSEPLTVPAPEPSSLVLGLLAFAGLAAVAMRRGVAKR